MYYIVTIDDRGAIKRLGFKAHKAMSSSLEEIAVMIRVGARKIVPVDTGLLKSSIGIQGSKLLWKVGSATPYAFRVEHGTPPGHWPKYEDILGWVKRKQEVLGISRRAIPRVAYKVRWKIGLRGIKPRPYMLPAMKSVIPKIRRIVYKWIEALS